MDNDILQSALFVILLVVVAWPVGRLMWKVMEGHKNFLTPVFTPVEKLVYKLSAIDQKEEMNWKQYLIAVLLFNAFGFLFVFLLQILQGVLPLNPEGLSSPSWHLSFNTAVSFATNTNWQAYSGETTLSYLTQMLGLTVQNFVSAATGIAVLFALVRGFTRKQTKMLGNFWVDLTRVTLYVLIPVAFVLAIVLVSQGVVQNFSPYQNVGILSPFVSNGNTIATPNPSDGACGKPDRDQAAWDQRWRLLRRELGASV